MLLTSIIHNMHLVVWYLPACFWVCSLDSKFLEDRWCLEHSHLPDALYNV